MKNSISIILIIVLLTHAGCNSSNGDSTPDWILSEPISESEIHVKKGDCIAFKHDDGNYIIGIIAGFHKSQGDIWYAICFANYYDGVLPNEHTIDTLKLNAVRVGYSTSKDYLIGIDVTWARDTLIDQHNAGLPVRRIARLEELEIEGEGTAYSQSQLFDQFDLARKLRLFPGKYHTDLSNASFQRFFYLDVSKVSDAILRNDQIKKNHR